MNEMDSFLMLRGRNLALALDQKHMPTEAAMVTELLTRLEQTLNGAAVKVPQDQVLIEKEAFKNMFETAGLFEFLVNNIGRLSYGIVGSGPNPKFRFALNPPGRRQQFLRGEVIEALQDIRNQLKTPQYG